MPRRITVLLVAVTLVGGLAACGSNASTASTTSTTVPQKAGPNPSKSAQMVCAIEAQKDLAQSIGVIPVHVTTPTWVDHLYSCDYVYANGTIGFQVKELSSVQETTDYFNALGTRLHRTSEHLSLSQGAYATADGSIVLRKDYKVLLIDASRLPAHFGKPPLSPEDTALSAALVILGCWTGS